MKTNEMIFAVESQAQYFLFCDELCGQLSDGHWENTTPFKHWEPWAETDVIVDPQNPGRNFKPIKDNYRFTDQRLLDVVADRMIENVRTKTGNTEYNEKDLIRDLRRLTNLCKMERAESIADFL